MKNRKQNKANHLFVMVKELIYSNGILVYIQHATFDMICLRLLNSRLHRMPDMLERKFYVRKRFL